MFIPNTDCQIKERGARDRYNEYSYGKPRRARCSIIKLKEARGKTSVRTDSSASRGNAEEITSDARLLLPSSESINRGDLIKVYGFVLKVVSIFPRIAVNGRLDHWQIDAEIEVSSGSWA